MADDRLRRININIPNDQLSKWLLGPQCKAAVTKVTAEIYSIYVSSLPVVTGNLRGGADMYVDHGGWGVDQDRWFGFIGNHALSYRNTKGQPYPRFIEYGKPTKGIDGGHHLQRAADLVAGHLGGSGFKVRGIERTPHGLRSKKTGRYVANPLNQDNPRRRRRRGAH